MCEMHAYGYTQNTMIGLTLTTYREQGRRAQGVLLQWRQVNKIFNHSMIFSVSLSHAVVVKILSRYRRPTPPPLHLGSQEELHLILCSTIC